MMGLMTSRALRRGRSTALALLAAVAVLLVAAVTAGAASPGLRPTAMQLPSGAQMVYFHDEGGGISQMQWDPADHGWHLTPLGIMADGAGRAAGDPVAVTNPAGAQMVYFRGANGTMWQWQWDPGKRQWFLTQLMGQPAGDPAVVTGANDLQLLYFRNTTGGISQLMWDPADRGWHLTTLGGSAAGDPVATMDANGYQMVYFRGTNGALWQWQFDPGTRQWYLSQLMGQAAGDPTLVTGANGTQLLYFRNTTGGISQLMWDAADRGWHLTTLGGSAAGDPVAVSADNGRQMVYFRGTNGALWQWQWDPGTRQWYLSQLMAQPKADPAVVSGANGLQLIYFRDATKQLSQLMWDPADRGWHLTPLFGKFYDPPDWISWWHGGDDHSLDTLDEFDTVIGFINDARTDDDAAAVFAAVSAGDRNSLDGALLNKLHDGDLIRNVNTGEVFNYSRGKIRWIPSISVAQAVGADLASARRVAGSTVAALTRDADIGPYKTSWDYGGPNRTVDTDAERQALAPSLPDSSIDDAPTFNDSALWAGLTPTEQDEMIDYLLARADVAPDATGTFIERASLGLATFHWKRWLNKDQANQLIYKLGAATGAAATCSLVASVISAYAPAPTVKAVAKVVDLVCRAAGITVAALVGKVVYALAQSNHPGIVVDVRVKVELKGFPPLPRTSPTFSIKSWNN